MKSNVPLRGEMVDDLYYILATTEGKDLIFEITSLAEEVLLDDKGRLNFIIARHLRNAGFEVIRSDSINTPRGLIVFV